MCGYQFLCCSSLTSSILIPPPCLSFSLPFLLSSLYPPPPSSFLLPILPLSSPLPPCFSSSLPPCFLISSSSYVLFFLLILPVLFSSLIHSFPHPLSSPFLPLPCSFSSFFFPPPSSSFHSSSPPSHNFLGTTLCMPSFGVSEGPVRGGEACWAH